MNSKTKELIIDLLIYLDTLDNWNREIVGIQGMQIIYEMNKKHKNFSDAEKRHKLICKIIKELEEN